MGKYFTNPELKRSSIFITVVSLIALIVCLLAINIDYMKLKKTYIRSNMAIVGSIMEKYPGIKNDVVSTVTKGAKPKNVEYGRKILRDYGYGESLNIGVIPGIETNYDSLVRDIFIIIVCFSVIIFLINYLSYSGIYKKIDKLTIAVKNITDFNFETGIYENAEGEFAKLSHEFCRMRVIMKNNIEESLKEKNFLSRTLSDISHQLKTPIAALMIYNDILTSRKIDDDKRKYFLDSSRQQLERIEWLVKSLLQLAKLDAGVIKFERTNCDINDTIDDAVETMRAKASRDGVALSFSPVQKQIIMVHDPRWLSEAFINIIKNAIEHTEKGGTVEVSSEETSVCVKISIKDNGEGIPSDELPKIFERFYKGKGSKQTESVGIGLALSKSIIEGQGGMVEVKSKVNEGTEFAVTFLREGIC